MRMKQLLLTLILTITVIVVWEILELLIYGEIQPRLVDDIMMIVFMPFIYKATEQESSR